ncbi:Methyltransferase domain-containing protein [Loktanella sp. DSM 29012]|uniref:class I SAM-dependent methyltransferase n=1 Tax=Loktanella sp. DSM 29012 TaxID=1881056 RepID=UPI0008ADD3B0|nr:class I SAM-dependent methyltransferase [Loktanella sp. DSM 29012]SEQ22273.1 Methyltransferase domain-containing protein [Loktanella sp. DSM 29012]
MSEIWTQRYDRPDYLFGMEPTEFLVTAADRVPATDALCIADGEGRHSAYLAQRGFDVTAFDPAPTALEKARRLDVAKGVTVARHQASLDDWDWTQSYGAVVAMFIQFQGPEARLPTFERLRQATRPSGHVILKGFAPRQVDYGTGGPSDRENMYTTDFLEQQFSGWTLHHLRDHDAPLSSGPGHDGVAALVELIAQKPG